VCQDIGMAEPRTKNTILADDLVSIPQAAKELSVNWSTVYRWIKKGEVIPIRIANQVFITVDDLRVLKDQRKGMGHPKAEPLVTTK